LSFLYSVLRVSPETDPSTATNASQCLPSRRREHDFEPCYHLPNQSLMACKLHVVQFNLPCSFCCIRSRR